MAATISQQEELPEAWPTITTKLALPLRTGEEGALWQRIEAWVNVRWTPRAVVWIVEGPGEWVPPLSPATITAVSIWDDAWITTTAAPSPLGGLTLDQVGPYRVTATVGGGTLPPSVEKAFTRFADYLSVAVDRNNPGGSLAATSWSEKQDLGGGASHEMGASRPASWLARSLVNSGAADLLRPYRRA